MHFRGAADAFDASQVRAGTAGVASAALQGGRLSRSTRQSLEQAVRSFDHVQPIEPFADARKGTSGIL